MSTPQPVAKWIEDNGYMMRLRDGMWYDVLSDEVFVRTRKNGKIVKAKITPRASYKKPS